MVRRAGSLEVEVGVQSAVLPNELIPVLSDLPREDLAC